MSVSRSSYIYIKLNGRYYCAANSKEIDTCIDCMYIGQIES